VTQVSLKIRFSSVFAIFKEIFSILRKDDLTMFVEVRRIIYESHFVTIFKVVTIILKNKLSDLY